VVVHGQLAVRTQAALRTRTHVLGLPTVLKVLLGQLVFRGRCREHVKATNSSKHSQSPH
jgi:hypothetical protein